MARFCMGCALTLTLLAGCGRPDVRFPQFIQDSMVMGTIMSELGALLDDELAARPAGDVSFSAPCAAGGSTEVIGTLRADGTADLALELYDCGIEHVEADGTSAAYLTIAGPMTFVRETDPASGFPRQRLRSAALAIGGTLTDQVESREVNDLCAVSATLVATDVSVALLGRVCERHTTSSLAHVSCGQ